MRKPILLIAALALSTPAFAEHPAFPDSPKAQQGLNQYDSLDIELALKSFVEASKDTKVPAPERAQIFLYAGLTAMTAGKMEEAKTYFGQAVDLDPKARFPEDDVPPKVAATLEDVRKSKSVDLTPKIQSHEDVGDLGKKEESASKVPLILGASGAVVGVAAIVVILFFVLRSPAPCPSPSSGTGCIQIQPSGAHQ